MNRWLSWVCAKAEPLEFFPHPSHHHEDMVLRSSTLFPVFLFVFPQVVEYSFYVVHVITENSRVGDPLILYA